MAVSTLISSKICGRCKYIGEARDAVYWNTLTCEGVCEKCFEEYKYMEEIHSRFIKINPELPFVPIDLECPRHKQRLEYHSKSRDFVFCGLCLCMCRKGAHVVLIDEYAKDAKKSNLFLDLDETIGTTIENLQVCANNLQSATGDIDKQCLAVKEAFKILRDDLNTRLNELERLFFAELDDKVSECKIKYGRIMSQCKYFGNDLQLIQTQINKVNEYGTDLQAFMFIKDLNQKVLKKGMEINGQLSSIKTYRLETDIDPNVWTFFENLKSLVRVKCLEEPANIEFKQPKLPCAEITIRPDNIDIQDFKFNALQRIIFNQKGAKNAVFSGCSVAGDGTLYLADYDTSKRLYQYNLVGETMRLLTVKTSASPFDVSAMDNGLVAVTFDDENYLEIIDVDNYKVVKRVTFQNNCRGISYHNEKLYVHVFSHGIVEMDRTGQILCTIKTKAPWLVYVSVSKDRLYYCDYNENTVHCCDLYGREVWVVNNTSFENLRRGITVDGNQNVYILDRNKLHMIQHDGNAVRTILSADDVIRGSKAVCYDAEKQELYVGNRKGCVSVYAVTKGGLMPPSHKGTNMNINEKNN